MSWTMHIPQTVAILPKWRLWKQLKSGGGTKNESVLRSGGGLAWSCISTAIRMNPTWCTDLWVASMPSACAPSHAPSRVHQALICSVASSWLNGALQNNREAGSHLYRPIQTTPTDLRGAGQEQPDSSRVTHALWMRRQRTQGRRSVSLWEK